MNSSVLLIFGIGGFIFFAIIFVVGFRMLRDEQTAKEKDKNKPPESKPATSQPVPAMPQPVPVPMPPPPPMSTQYDNAHEVLRVLRDNLTGRLIVEIAGRRYERVSDIRDPDIGRGFVTTLKDLQKFMAGTQSPATPMPSIPEPQRPPEPPPTASPQSFGYASPREVRGAGDKPPAPSPQPAAPAPSRKTLSDLPPIQKPSMNPFKQAKVLKDMEKE